ncbi:MAG: hypothetical protein ACPGED_08150 [Flavobacteriales bacterium]
MDSCLNDGTCIIAINNQRRFKISEEQAMYSCTHSDALAVDMDTIRRWISANGDPIIDRERGVSEKEHSVKFNEKFLTFLEDEFRKKVSDTTVFEGLEMNTLHEVMNVPSDQLKLNHEKQAA